MSPDYVKVGGPPDDWTELEVIDVDARCVLEGVVEADAEHGWAILIDPERPQRRILHQSKLFIKRKDQDGQ